MNYALRIIGDSLVLLLLLLLTSSTFDQAEMATVILFFMFKVTVESLAAIFDFPFKYFRRKKPTLEH